jgi:hypothetical protein
MASDLCGQAALRERGQDHHSRHDVMTPDMIRQLPAGHALVVRGGLSPVVARLGAGWKDRRYRRAARAGWAIAAITGALPPEIDDGFSGPVGALLPRRPPVAPPAVAAATRPGLWVVPDREAAAGLADADTRAYPWS